MIIKGDETIKTCDLCNTTNTRQWHNLTGLCVCNSCYSSLHKYLEGTIDPESQTGFQIILKHVVSDVLGDCNIISLPKYPYTLYSDVLGIISIKSSRITTNKWLFDRGSFKLSPDTYIFICLDENRTSIQHIYIIPENATIFAKSGFTITNSEIGLERWKEFEIETKIFNNIYQSINVKDFPEFRNFNNSMDISINIDTNECITTSTL